METYEISLKANLFLINAAENSVESDECNTRTILQRIAIKYQNAACECLNCYGDLIWHLTKKHTNKTAEDEKAVCEIFQDIWKYAVKFNAGKHDEQSFVALIALRRLLKNEEQGRIL